MNLDVNGAFIYFQIPIFGGINVTQTDLSLILVTLILCIASVYLGKRFTSRPGGLQVLVEKAVGMLTNLVVEAMGPHNISWVPFIGSIFLSSLVGSLIGMLGFVRSTTADLSVPLTWAVMVSVLIWYNNIKRNGVLGWLKGFTEPIWVMTPMNLVSEIAQPISMAFRHFGNVAGGGVITSVLYLAMAGLSSMVLGAISRCGILVCILVIAMGLALIILKPGKKKTLALIGGIVLGILGVFSLLQTLGLAEGIPILSVGIPAVLSLYFDLFSGFIQAFVFCLLTMVYISSACPPPEETAAE